MGCIIRGNPSLLIFFWLRGGSPFEMVAAETMRQKKTGAWGFEMPHLVVQEYVQTSELKF